MYLVLIGLFPVISGRNRVFCLENTADVILIGFLAARAVSVFLQSRSNRTLTRQAAGPRVPSRAP